MSDTPPPAAAAPQAAPARGGKLALLALILTVALAAGGYYWTRFVAEPGAAALRARLDDVGAERDELARRVSDADQRLAKLENSHGDMLAAIDTLRGDTQVLSRSVNELAAQRGDHALDWVLAECEYLVLTASQRLALAHDVASARAALVAADERLRGAEHPALAPLREQLARDLQALAAVAEPDIEGLSLKFAAQIRKADRLPTKAIAEVDTSFKHSREQRVTPDNWRGVLQAMWDDLMSLVQIKDDELPDSVLFDPKLRHFVEQNLKLELSSARLAILERDTTNYRVAVEIVQDAVSRYYDADDAGVKALAQMLTDVRNIELAPKLPEVNASLDAVRAAREALRATPVTPASPAPAPAETAQSTPTEPSAQP